MADERQAKIVDFGKLAAGFLERLPEPSGEEVGVDDGASEAREHHARLVRRGVPVKDIAAITNGTLRNTAALLAAVRFYNAADKRILVLSGPRGTGKTTAASWIIAQECPDEFVQYERPSDANRWPGDRHPRFVDVSELARMSRYEAATMEPLERCSMLALDDLGHEYADQKGSFLTTLDGLINRRYRDSLRTVVTTNLTSDAFKSRYGERIADRIREVGSFVEAAGESLRGKGGK